ncbi:MAG: hypothetical protein ABFS35_12775 [Bacteroidota bacterium]
MIVYGWKAAHIKSAQSRTATCPSCGTKGSLIFSVFSKHAHIFWIPLFPIGKTGAAQCQHCNYAMKANEMPDEIKREYNSLKSEKRAPIWQFSGLALIALLIAWGSISKAEEKKTEQDYISNPLSGDIYEFKTDSKNYSTLKVIEITKDSIIVSYNEYETTKMSGISEIDIEANYTDDLYVFSRTQIEDMYKEGTIYDVNRD